MTKEDKLKKFNQITNNLRYDAIDSYSIQVGSYSQTLTGNFSLFVDKFLEVVNHNPDEKIEIRMHGKAGVENSLFHL